MGTDRRVDGGSGKWSEESEGVSDGGSKSNAVLEMSSNLNFVTGVVELRLEPNFSRQCIV